MSSNEGTRKVLIVSRLATDAMEGSYARAFGQLGCEVIQWDMYRALDKHTRFGRAGRLAQAFLTVEPWMAKANRDLLVAVMDLRPEILIVGGTHRVMAGTLAQIKASLPDCSLVLVWPDTLLNCYSHSIQAIPVYDLIATYSKASIDSFYRLGGRRVEWVPLGFDPELHQAKPESGTGPREFRDCDASFVGNYTPERESIVARLTDSGFRIKVWGPEEWLRSAKDRVLLKKYFQGRPLFGEEFALAIRSAPLSLNPIAPSNFPSANMRFFEIPGCGGTAVSAACPEMEPQFPDGERCFYYRSEPDVIDVVRRLTDNPALRERVGISGREYVLANHTYRHRAIQMLNLLGAQSDNSRTRPPGKLGLENFS